jgi:hypothetical protein
MEAKAEEGKDISIILTEDVKELSDGVVFIKKKAKLIRPLHSKNGSDFR